jgi:hypothetical protein
MNYSLEHRAKHLNPHLAISHVIRVFFFKDGGRRKTEVIVDKQLRSEREVPLINGVAENEWRRDR